jgi:transposase
MPPFIAGFVSSARLVRSPHEKEVEGIEAHRFVFLDECATNRGMTRLWTRAPRGDRAIGSVPRNRGVSTTLIGALTLEGLQVVMTVEGGTTQEVFEAFVERLLLPELLAGDVVILDNFSSHKSAHVKALIELVGAELIHLPPYHPDLNPIENAWSKLKQHLRSAEARNLEELDKAIADGADQITIEDTAGWFSHCGYQLN